MGIWQEDLVETKAIGVGGRCRVAGSDLEVGSRDVGGVLPAGLVRQVTVDFGMAGVKPPHPALNLMDFRRSGKASPQVLIADWFQTTESFPPPAAFFPLRQVLSQPLANVAAGCDEGHAGGLLECFQTSDHGQQLQPFLVQVGLVGSDAQRVTAVVDRLQLKPPSPGGVFLRGGVGFGKQQEVGRSLGHAVGGERGRGGREPIRQTPNLN